MQKDTDCIKSGAYYKDPGTKELLTGHEERAVQCCISEAGKFIWPQVKFSNGSTGKILYSLWTSEEKEIYKQYRSGGASKVAAAKQQVHTELAVKQLIQEKPFVHQYGAAHYQVDESIASGNTLEYINKCNEHLGTWIFENKIYDLLTIKGTNAYIPIPRALIPLSARERLHIC